MKMTDENEKLIVEIKTLLNTGLSRRAIAKLLNVTPGRVAGLLYREGNKP